MTMTFPPRQIAILGALAIFFGVSSVVSMIFKWLSENMYFDLGFVGIVIGYGLLIGRGSSRKWALFFAGLGLILITAISGWLIYDSHFSDGKVAAQFNYLDWVEAVIVWVISLYFLIILKSKTYRDWFASVKEDTSAQKTFAWAVVIVSAFCSFQYESSTWQTYQTQKKMYPYQVEISPYDVESGEGVKSVSYESSVFPDSLNRRIKFPTMQFGSRYSNDGMVITIQGIATGAFKYTVCADGYHAETITIERDAPDPIRVPMVREKKSEE